MLCRLNVDKGNMNFDQIGKQHISRRPRPSPLKSPHRSPASFDAQFSQDVWPRQARTVSGGDVERDHPIKQRPSSGFSIPLSWVKNVVIAAGVLVIGVVGTNWDSISGTFNSQGIAPETLQDTAAYRIMEANYEPVVPYQETAQGEIPFDLTDVFTWIEYEIKQGDTVSGIASQYSVSSGSIIALNNTTEAWNIRTGSTLKIPNMDGIPYTVAKNDNLSKIAEKLGVPQNAILDANNLSSDTIKTGEILFIPGAKMSAHDFDRAYRRDAIRKMMISPVSGKLTSGYGWREDPVKPVPGEKRFHRGADFIGKMGDPIKAAMKGTVQHIDNNPNLGNFIILKHDDGYQTLYAHLSAFTVKVGEAVKQGQEIGKVGNTGYTTGPHLHLEAFRNGNRIDPLDLIK
jgi:murein DD-endopeptidase MepM/ murein hydrolase activator NlpD